MPESQTNVFRIRPVHGQDNCVTIPSGTFPPPDKMDAYMEFQQDLQIFKDIYVCSNICVEHEQLSREEFTHVSRRNMNIFLRKWRLGLPLITVPETAR